RYSLTKLPARHRLLETLLGAWRAFGGSGSPTIAILDWKGLPTHSEFLLFQRYFHEHRLQALICSPDDLRYADRRLSPTLPSPSSGLGWGGDPHRPGVQARADERVSDALRRRGVRSPAGAGLCRRQGLPGQLVPRQAAPQEVYLRDPHRRRPSERAYARRAR